MHKRFVAVSSVMVVCLFAALPQQIAYGQITSPSNNTFLIAGSNQEITWQSSRDSTSIVLLQYSTNGGHEWNYIGTSGIAAGSYEWVIPVGTNSFLCKVRMVKCTRKGYAQVSSTGIFSIAAVNPLSEINEVFSHRVISLSDSGKHHFNRIKWFK